MILDRTYINPRHPEMAVKVSAFKAQCFREFANMRRAGHTIRFSRDPSNDSPQGLAIICHT